MNTKIRGYLVNAFTEGHAGGSPTTVVLNAAGLTDVQMQDIATRMLTSHTAFVFEPATPGQNLTVRFFTSREEILNCGHGTIAVHYARAKQFNCTGSHTLFQQAKEGLQQIEIAEEDGTMLVFLHLNEIRFSPVDIATTMSLLGALRITGNQLIDTLPVILASPGSNRFLLGLKSPVMLNGLNPDFERLKEICLMNKSIGCFVYAVEQKQPVFSVTARMFAPVIGVNEDIINGNSSGCLGAYFLRNNGKEALELLVNQGQKFNSEGQVIVRVSKKGNEYRTLIGGTARMVNEIEIVSNIAAE